MYKVPETYWTEGKNKSVTCLICPHGCVIRPDGTGICRTRTNREGVLYSLAYGNPCSAGIDPVEKKPLYHFLPGTRILSIATAGCNFHCLNCQNWTISQTGPKELQPSSLREGRQYVMTPEQVVDSALRNNAPSIAFTYTEPTVFYEYMYDTAVLAHSKGLKTVMISNGYINPTPLADLIPYLDAANIDLKSLDDATYRTLTGGRLQPVLYTLLALKKAGVWTEITHLVIPQTTDDPVHFKALCEWLVDNDFKDNPLHISRFYPSYKLEHLSPTPIATMNRARDTALDAGLQYVYVGNMPEDGDSHTYCPQCNQAVIKRHRYTLQQVSLTSGACNNCGTSLPGIWY
jgi:pyruvate formate lyase activating enzyme